MFLKIMRSPDPIDYLTTDVELTSVADAIRAKGGTSAQLEYPSEFITAIEDLPGPGSITQSGSNITLGEEGDTVSLTELTVTQNGTYSTNSESEGYNSVVVNVPTIVVEAEEKDVNFIDYDGTIVYSYTVDEFNALTEMPANPTHDGLESQGWNWTLSDAKTYLQTCKYLVIGQYYGAYTTIDGHNFPSTKIYIELQEGYLSPYLGIAAQNQVQVNWGDHPINTFYTITGAGWNSASDVVSTQHTYAAPGRYCITIMGSYYTFFGYNSTIGSMILWANDTSSAMANKPYQNSIIKIEFGSSNVYFESYAFANCYRLSTISCASASGDYQHKDGTFNNCYSLKSIIGFIKSAPNCYSLKNIALPKKTGIMSDSLTFNYCYCLSSVAINSITEIKQGAFSYCNTLSKIYIPSTVTNIVNSAFYNCPSLRRIYFTRSTPPTVANSNAFSNLPTDCIIFVPGDTSTIINSYLSATNYPSYMTYQYIGYATYASGEGLPYSCTSGPLRWYATKEEAIANSGTLLQFGTGNEIYCYIVDSSDPL